MSLKIIPFSQSKELLFVRLHENPEYFPVILDYFVNRVAPVYGTQATSIKKLKEGKDRKCDLMVSTEEGLLGAIVYKSELQNEYGLDRGFELKSLFLVEPERYSGQGLGSKLWGRVFELAKDMKATRVFCTANSKLPEAIKCAKKNGMQFRFNCIGNMS